MNILFGIIGGIVLACLLNKFLVSKIGFPVLRIGLKVTSFFVCIILCALFLGAVSLWTGLNTFLENRIVLIETELTRVLPDSDMLEHGVAIDEFASAFGDMRQTISNMDTGRNSFFENLVFETFLGRLDSYADAVESGISTAAIVANEDGLITVRSILTVIKDTALRTVLPHFVFVKIGIALLFFIYVGILVLLKRRKA